MNNAPLEIRYGTEADLPRLVEIYNHYIMQTPTTFDLVPYKVDQRSAWFNQFATSGRHRLIVGIQGGVVVGYASSAQFRTKAAYDPSIETSVYCCPKQTGRGYGSQLYTELFRLLKDEDIHRAYAGITIPNDASVKIHESFGFQTVGTFGEVGRKFDRYWDVVFMQKAMR